MSLPADYAPVETREQLLGMLAEAAEIEHNLMCCYLYAAFSLKQDDTEDLSDIELAAVRRWRRVVLDIAIEEMSHLTMVANIISAIGGTPHFARQNFPIAAGYHPSGIVVKLAPFNMASLNHFIFLERPDGLHIADGEGFEPAAKYARSQFPGRIMPNAQDYDTVGQLYEAIANGLRSLNEKLGEDALFAADPVRQLGADVTNLPNVARVKCLKTALEAIDIIITQGEGALESEEKSHYQRFCDVRDEYLALLDERPDFIPARPAATNPLMRTPIVGTDKVWISASPAAELLDIANAAYNMMLRLLLQSYADTRGVGVQRAMADAATDLMYTIAPLASELTRLPAQDGNEECTAGISFATLRATTTLPVGPATDHILVERLGEVVAACEPVVANMPRLKAVPERLKMIMQILSEGLAIVTEPENKASVQPLAGAAPRTPPTPTKENGVEIVPGERVTIVYNGKRCIHARHCVLGAPTVFKANVEGPWIDPDTVSAEALITVAHMCPSGAIQYRRNDGGDEEQAPPINLVQLRENGPLGVRAQIRLNGEMIGMRATLCRCGASKTKPFCDGSHNEIAFKASGEPESKVSEPLAVRGGLLDVRTETNGPLSVRGNLEICAGTGRTIDRVGGTRLCRCGHSANKPFCDNSHERVGFIAD